jgi:uncharacterized membrane protein
VDQLRSLRRTCEQAAAHTLDIVSANFSVTPSTMTRLLLVLLGIYGVRLSSTASGNIDATAARAAAGDIDAQRHFTQTRYARVLGPKNSDLGMVYYAVVAAAAITGAVRLRPIRACLRLASLLSLAMSAYLLYALVRLRTLCPICLQGHALNLATWWLLRQELQAHS